MHRYSRRRATQGDRSHVQGFTGAPRRPAKRVRQRPTGHGGATPHRLPPFAPNDLAIRRTATPDESEADPLTTSMNPDRPRPVNGRFPALRHAAGTTFDHRSPSRVSATPSFGVALCVKACNQRAIAHGQHRVAMGIKGLALQHDRACQAPAVPASQAGHASSILVARSNRKPQSGPTPRPTTFLSPPTHARSCPIRAQ